LWLKEQSYFDIILLSCERNNFDRIGGGTASASAADKGQTNQSATVAVR